MFVVTCALGSVVTSLRERALQDRGAYVACVYPQRFLWWVQIKTPSSNFPPVPPRQPTTLILPINYLTSKLTRKPVANNLPQHFQTCNRQYQMHSTRSLIHTLFHSLTHSFAHSLTHSLTRSLSHSLFHSFTRNHSLIHSLTHTLFDPLIRSFIHSITRTLTQSLTHSFTHSLYSGIYPTRSLTRLQLCALPTVTCSTTLLNAITHNCHKQNIRGPLHWNDC